VRSRPLTASWTTLTSTRRACTPGTYLLIEDSSEFSYSGRQPVGGLGFIGNAREGLQGLVLHSVLAVRWWGKTDTGKRKRPEVEVLGVAGQSYRVRREKRGRGKESSTRRKHRPRESEDWIHSGDRLGSPPSDPRVRWVRVADRGRTSTNCWRSAGN